MLSGQGFFALYDVCRFLQGVLVRAEHACSVTATAVHLEVDACCAAHSLHTAMSTYGNDECI